MLYTLLVLIAMLFIGGAFDRKNLQKRGRAYDIFVSSIIIVVICVIAVLLLGFVFTAILI